MDWLNPMMHDFTPKFLMDSTGDNETLGLVTLTSWLCYENE